VLKKLYPEHYSEYVEKYSSEYDVDKELIYAMIKEESNFNPDASSSKSAIGLMQLVQSTADEVGKELNIDSPNLKDPETNIKIGTKYISNLLKKYDGNIALSIAAYNAGIGKVDKWVKEGLIKEDGSDIENIPFNETKTHVRKVLKTYRLYKNLY